MRLEGAREKIVWGELKSWKGGHFWTPQPHAKPGPVGSMGRLSRRRETQETWKDVLCIQWYFGVWQIYFKNVVLNKNELKKMWYLGLGHIE